MKTRKGCIVPDVAEDLRWLVRNEGMGYKDDYYLEIYPGYNEDTSLHALLASDHEVSATLKYFSEFHLEPSKQVRELMPLNPKPHMVVSTIGDARRPKIP